jgi:hypothetical protein
MQAVRSSEKRKLYNNISAFSSLVAQDIVANLTFLGHVLLSKLDSVCYTTLEAGKV